MGKVTHTTVRNLIRAKVGRTEAAQLTDADRDAIQARQDEQAARLARIAARNADKNA